MAAADRPRLQIRDIRVISRDGRPSATDRM